MATLQKDKLLEYLKHVISLETSVVAQNQIIATCKKFSEGRKPSYTEEKPWVEECTAPIPDDEDLVFAQRGYAIAGIVFLVGMIVAPMEGGSFRFALIISSILACIPIAMALPCHINYKKQKEVYFNKLEIVRMRNCQREEKAKKLNEERRARYHTGMEQWSKESKEMLDYLTSPLQETEATLAQLYSKDVIFPKYRNLPALTSIYEYLLSGRCSELTGPNGAYNLYEDEIRKDTVISQLNTVIENLEKIRQALFHTGEFTASRR